MTATSARRSSRSNTGNAISGRGRAWLCRALLFFPLLNGCYIFNQAKGQLAIMTGSRPLDEVYGDPGLSDAQARRLDVVKQAKRFAEERLGLKPSNNYTTYYDLGRRAVTYVVSAVRKDRFEVYTWWFPIVGSLPYKGFFDRKDAVAEAAALEKEGWDVMLGESAAYSTLGWFKDPVFSSMLNTSDANLACTIIHELVHGTIYVTGSTDFNESLAQFVGTEGTVQLFELKYGRDHPMVRAARQKFVEDARFDALIRAVYDRLDRLYDSPISRDEKLRKREEIFEGAKGEFRRLAPTIPGHARFGELELDNARIVAQIRYGRYNSFQRIFERAQGSWPAFFATVSAAASSGNPLGAVEALAKGE